MPIQHTVTPGEHLSLIAASRGFSDTKVILDHGANSALAGRPHPTILNAEETVTIPDLAPKQLSLATSKGHKLVLQRIKTKLDVVFKTFRGGDTAATEAEVTVGEAAPRPVPLSGGEMKLDTKPTDGAALARVQPPGEGEPALEWRLLLGHLGRGETDDGAMMRLRNLGYYRSVSDDADARERLAAVEEFQTDNDISVTGKLDQATKDKIAEVHGC